MFDLRIRCKSIEEAERIIACLKHAADPAVVQSVSAQIAAPAEVVAAVAGIIEAAVAPKKRGRPPREVAPPLEEKPVAPVEVAEVAADVAETPVQQAHTLDAIKAALMAVQAKYGAADMVKPLGVLSQFGAGRISEVKADDYPAFIAACQAA